MTALRWIGRLVGFTLALLLGALGGLGLALAQAPRPPAPQALALLDRLTAGLRPLIGPALPQRLAAHELAGPAAYVLLGAALVVTLGTWLATRARRGPVLESAPGTPAPTRAERRSFQRIEKQASSLARKGHPLEAAELCFGNGLLDRAAEFFVEAGEFVRAAEIRHDQNRFVDAAELYLKAGDPDSAGAILAAQNESARAAECFLKAGRKTVAAEMLEKAGDHRRAAASYAEAGFHRNAAQAYVRCQEWEKAAASLEKVLGEEGARTGSGQDPRRAQELRKLVLQAGKLYEQAGKLDRAEGVLERGGCPGPAAEIAFRLERFAKASELFLAAGQPLRAAESLKNLGEEQAAARILGEYHRDRGEDTEAAREFETAGEFLAAGDLHRKLEDFAKAGSCYERYGDLAQAAEMFRLAGDAPRAGAAYENASRFEEAAACYEEAGDRRRAAKALARAGRLLRAGQIYHEDDVDDAAIKVLQRIDAASPDFHAASALLGEIFRSRGMLSLAIKKLRQALGDAEMGRANLGVYYTLATVYEANGELREAVELYEKILAVDYHYEDVESRLAAARERVRLAPPPADPAASSAGSGAFTPRTTSGRYRIVGELGRGGMGIVYKAEDTVLDRVVAYKVLPDALKENPQALRNFLREAKSAAQLNHPNIVTVYDAGEQDGVYYIAMEYVDGTTLKEIVRRRGAVSSSGVLHVLVQMCEALAYAHEKKIIHRDVKTANTMWTRDRKAKIMDFGLAKVVEEVRNHTTLVSGTPYYMSPEQTLGRNVDHRTDIYSLGVTLFELATGALPFRDGNIPYHHVHTPAPDPRSVNAKIPPLLAGIVSRCLHKDPAERYQSARDILGEVRAGISRGGVTPAH